MMTLPDLPIPPKRPILYSFRRCPYAMRARLALLASGIQVELREVVLRNKPPDMLVASPKGTVPVLVLPNGEVIDQSLDVMLWALQQNDPAHWLPADRARLDAGMALLARCDGEFKHHLDRYKYPQRFADADSASSQAVCGAFAQEVEAKLAQNKYLFDSKLSIFDAGCMPFIRQFSRVDAVWFAAQPWPYLQAWLAGFEASDAFQQVMTVYPPWALGVPQQVFPKK